MAELSPSQMQRIEENRRKAVAILDRKRRTEESNGTELSGSMFSIPLNDASKETEQILCEQQIAPGLSCHRDNVDLSIRDFFGELVCSVCKQKYDDYDLLNKATAMKEYLISDDALSTLKFRPKDNPHHPSWTAMKLYMRKHVRALAIKRYGSLDKLEEERNLREENRFQRELEKSKEALQSSAENFRSVLSSRSETVSRLTKVGSSSQGHPPSLFPSSTSALTSVSASASASASTVVGQLSTSSYLNSGGKRRSALANPQSKKRKALNGLISCIRGDL